LSLGMLSRTAEEGQQQQEEPVPASMAAASMHVFASKLAYRPVRACLHAGAVTLSQALRFMCCPLACVCQATILDKCLGNALYALWRKVWVCTHSEAFDCSGLTFCSKSQQGPCGLSRHHVVVHSTCMWLACVRGRVGVRYSQCTAC
jgi:hypothetical protein